MFIYYQKTQTFVCTRAIVDRQFCSLSSDIASFSTFARQGFDGFSMGFILDSCVSFAFQISEYHPQMLKEYLAASNFSKFMYPR